MTIKDSNIKSFRYIGDGVNRSFGFPFRIFNIGISVFDEVLVYVLSDGETSVLPTQFISTIAYDPDQENNPGGTVVLNNPLPDGDELMIVSNLPFLQLMGVQYEEGFSSSVWNAGMDRLEIQILQLKEQVDRSIKVPIMSDQNPDMWAESFWEAYSETLSSRDQAVQSAATAVQAANAATSSANAAQNSAAAAAQSESNVSQSAAAAEVSKQAAESAAATATSAATTAINAAQAAASSATAAAQSATNASQSSAVASASELAAQAAAVAAAASQAAALASESAAQASATAAQQSAETAGDYRDQCIAIVSSLGNSNWRGYWLESVTYNAGDSVFYSGTVYVAKQDVPVGAPPSNETYWDPTDGAPLDSPHFVGTPTTPTPNQLDDSHQIANTSWVRDQILKRVPLDEMAWQAVYTYADNGDIAQVDYTFSENSNLRVREVYGYNADGDVLDIDYYMTINGATYSNIGKHTFYYKDSGDLDYIIWG